ncbi:unnamed protein product [Camellia sinensis]
MKLGNENNRPFVLTRAGFIGSQSGLSGQPLSGPDIGGFEGNATPKLFGRWMGLGAMFPFCRGHSDTGTIDHEPWSFGEEVGEGMEGILVTIGDGQICYRELAKSIAEELLFFEISMQTECEEVCRLALKRRYRLLPHIYTLFYMAHTRDPKDPRLRTRENSFMLGPLLIYTRRGGNGEGTLQSLSTVSDQGIDQLQLVLPKGIWLSFDFDDSHPHGKAKGVLFEDDGDGYEFTRGEYLLTTYVAELESSVVTVRISQTEGSWKRPKRCLHVQLLLGGCAMLDAWGIDGEVLHIMMPSEDEVSNLVSMSEKQYKIRMENAKRIPEVAKVSGLKGELSGFIVGLKLMGMKNLVVQSTGLLDGLRNMLSLTGGRESLMFGDIRGGVVIERHISFLKIVATMIDNMMSDFPHNLISYVNNNQFLCDRGVFSGGFVFSTLQHQPLPSRLLSPFAVRLGWSGLWWWVMRLRGCSSPRRARELATTASAGFLHVNQGKGAERMWVRFPVMGVRNCSTVALDEKKKKQVEMGSAGGVSGGDKAIVSYWGFRQQRLPRRMVPSGDGPALRPWETYKSDLSINLKKHHVPVTFLDKVAFWTVKSLRYPSDVFFQTIWMSCNDARNCGCCPRHGWRDAIALQVIEAFEHSGGWIKTLLDEAENERMHLMTFMEVAKPRWYEHALVFTVQGVFFNAYFLAYLISPKLAHRMVGYLEEEAIHSYTEFLKELDKGNIENVLASAIAIDYWQLPPNSTLRDVVMVVRADEAHHRMLTTLHRDIHYQGHELKEAPAPLGYH